MAAHNRFRELSEKVVAPILGICAALIIRTRRPVVVAVTGSVGKTTTKETVAAVLMHPVASANDVVGTVRKTGGNLNTNLGVPLTILGYDDWWGGIRGWLINLLLLPFRTIWLATVAPYPKVLVVEIALSSDGSVRRNARIVRPRVAIVTEVGPAHLEYFGTVEHVAEEKGALVRAIPPSGLAVLNRTNPLVAGMAAYSRAPVVEVEGRGIELARNSARSVAQYFGLSRTDIDTALRDLKPVRRRLDKVVLSDMTVIDDAFSANPLSMKLALDVLTESAAPGQRRVAILGTMRELGPETERYHKEIGAYAKSRADLIVGVGEHAEHYRPEHHFRDSAACAAGVRKVLRVGDVVLLKGSAALELKIVVKALRGCRLGC